MGLRRDPALPDGILKWSIKNRFPLKSSGHFLWKFSRSFGNLENIVNLASIILYHYYQNLRDFANSDESLCIFDDFLQISASVDSIREHLKLKKEALLCKEGAEGLKMTIWNNTRISWNINI